MRTVSQVSLEQLQVCTSGRRRWRERKSQGMDGGEESSKSIKLSVLKCVCVCVV